MKRYFRGEGYYADLDPVIGSEQGGCRLVLILQNDEGNHHSPTVIVSPITGKTAVKPPLPTHYLLKAGNGLKEPSLVLLEQLRTLDKQRLSRYIGKVTAEDLRRIDQALSLSVGLLLPPVGEAYLDALSAGGCF